MSAHIDELKSFCADGLRAHRDLFLQTIETQMRDAAEITISIDPFDTLKYFLILCHTHRSLSLVSFSALVRSGVTKISPEDLRATRTRDMKAAQQQAREQFQFYFDGIDERSPSSVDPFVLKLREFSRNCFDVITFERQYQYWARFLLLQSLLIFGMASEVGKMSPQSRILWDAMGERELQHWTKVATALAAFSELKAFAQQKQIIPKVFDDVSPPSMSK